MKVLYADGDELVARIEGAALVRPEEHGGRVALVVGLLVGEPVFVFRARDKRSLMWLRAYQSETSGFFTVERSMELARTLSDYQAWQREHVDVVRDPD